MRLFSKISAVLIILFYLVFAPACVKISVNSQDAQKYRKTADEYLKKIESEAPVQDTLTVLPDSITAVMGEDFLVYTGWSEYYQDVFSVFVNKIDGGCMDQYYRLYLKEEARLKYQDIAEMHSLPAYSEFVLPAIVSSKLSGAKVRSMAEFWEMQDGRECIWVTYPKLTEEERLNVLKTLRDVNFYAKISEEDAEEVYYVLRDGVYIEEASGKDGGKMIERRQITLDGAE